MLCPKCRSDFETLVHGGVEIDRCTGCGGIWLDAREQERLVREGLAAAVDTGDPRLGRRMDAVRQVRCPRCCVDMMRVADRTQFHIEYETCPDCSGAFFDAGELDDLSELTALERLKQLIDQWLSVR